MASDARAPVSLCPQVQTLPQGIFVWDSNDYALAVTERLGLEGKGGMVRVGAVH